MGQALTSRRLLAAGAALVLLAAAAAGLALRSATSKPHSPSPSTSTSPTSDLAITAIRAHPLTPGTMTVEREIAPRGGCPTFVVSFHSDGFKEYALMSQPPTSPPAGGYPVLVLAHGYINPATYQTTGTDYQDFINAFCNAGFLVLKPDYRGHGDSAGSATGGHFSPGYTYDILNLTASLPSLSQANAHRVALLGHSMGGHVVLRALVASHGLPIKAAVFASGVVGSLQDIAYNWPRPEVPPDIPPIRDSVIAHYGSPEQNPAFWHDASAINYVAAITAAIQINHGDADTVVPLAFSQHLDAALTAAGKPHQFNVYPDGDHQYSDPAVRSHFLANSISFLSAHL